MDGGRAASRQGQGNRRAGGRTVRTVEEHLESILLAVGRLAPLTRPLAEVGGCLLAEDVVAGGPLPPFANSSMDGYAVRAADLTGASPAGPVVLAVAGEIPAGSPAPYALAPGHAYRIMTGAPIPAGADAVVPQERTDQGLANVAISVAPTPHAYVRDVGSDVRQGATVVHAGTALGPRQVALLAATGHPRVLVHPRPRVVVVSTGSELRPPGTPLSRGQINDSNSYMLAAAVMAAGGLVFRVGPVDDDPRVLADVLADQLVRADALITSGGVSVGAYDVVRDVLARMGTVWFGPVAMHPGKPQGFGTIGDDAVPVFALPGNPVSSYVSFEVFVRPALRRMRGLAAEGRPVASGRWAHSLDSPPHRRQYLRVALEHAGRAGSPARVTAVGGPSSHLIGGLAAADALAVIPEEVTAVRAGDPVALLMLDDVDE